MVCNTALLKGSAEEISYVMLDTHCGEYDGEILIRAAAQRSLLYDLCGKLVVRKTVAGKDRQLCPRISVVSPSIAEIPVRI